MSDVTLVAIDEMKTLYDGLARRARATLGVTAWGMHVMTLPPHWSGDFFATQPAGGRLDRIALVDACANGQPTLVSYAHEGGSGVWRAYGVLVLAIQGSSICGFTGFPNDPEPFRQLDLPLGRSGF